MIEKKRLRKETKMIDFFFFFDFMPGRLIMKQFTCYSDKKELHMSFIDLEKAYDRAPT